MKGRIEKDLVLIKNKLTDLQQQTSPFKIYIQKEVPMSENLLEYYRKSDGATINQCECESGSEEKNRELKFELPRSHSRSRSFSVPGAGLEPAQP
jgi:hypothetical protein